MVSRGLCFN